MRKIIADQIQHFVGGGLVGSLATIHSIFAVTILGIPMVDYGIKIGTTLVVAFVSGLVTAYATEIVKKRFRKNEKQDDDENGEED